MILLYYYDAYYLIDSCELLIWILQQANNLPTKRNFGTRTRAQHGCSEIKSQYTRQESMGRIRSNTAIAKMIGIMTVSFYVCWTPYAMRSILELVGFKLSHIPSTLSLLFTKLGVIVNPLIYIFFNKEVSWFWRRYTLIYSTDIIFSYVVSNARIFYILQLSDSSIHTSILVKITSNIVARIVANNDEPRVDLFTMKAGNKNKALEQNLGQFTKLMVGYDHAMFIKSILNSKPLSIEERIGLR